MELLKRHKKRGIEGFKDYVCFLEETPNEKVKDMIALGLLEDPVYMTWIVKNLVDYTYLSKLSSDDIYKIWGQLPNPVMIFVYALFKSPVEEDIVYNKFDDRMRRKYKDEAELVEAVQYSQQENCRLTIMKKIHELQKFRAITGFAWQVPSEKILIGENFELNRGMYVSKFEDGKVALKGRIASKMRDGEWDHYYPNGQLMARGSYQQGEKEGDWEFYYANGFNKASGYYLDNLKDGDWSEYDKDGNEEVFFYKRGKVDIR
ncbi:MAG: hypothetical protein ISR65_06830 [Bacteriovoracaceae bacterium]|nr:hypothetical protein [Bacteriovoracaceae bacterium]